MIDIIPSTIIRGGSSKGIFFRKEDLPNDESKRKKVLLDIMEGKGHGDVRQIDGLGGANSLTAKIAVVNKSDDPKVDLDYHFYQVALGKGELSDSQNCGNILSGVVPFALQENMCEANRDETTKVVKMLNSNSICEVTVETPNGVYNPNGDTFIHGVPGTGSKIHCNYLYIAGKNTGDLIPTGSIINVIDDIEITCVDNGMPVVLLRAKDLEITGYESKFELDQNEALKARLESIRLQAGKMMNLGDVSKKTVPKMTIVSAPKNGGIINTCTFIPYVCHATIGVLGAVSAVTASILPDSIAEQIIGKQNLADGIHRYAVEHPAGTLEVTLEVKKENDKITFPKSGVIRTARILLKGEAFLP